MVLMSLCLIGFHTYYRCVSGGLPLFWLGRRLPPEFEFKWGLSHSFGLAAASPPSSNFSGGLPQSFGLAAASPPRVRISVGALYTSRVFITACKAVQAVSYRVILTQLVTF